MKSNFIRPYFSRWEFDVSHLDFSTCIDIYVQLNKFSNYVSNVMNVFEKFKRK